MLLEKNGEIIPEKMKRRSQRENNAQMWMSLVMEVNSDAIKNMLYIAIYIAIYIYMLYI